MCFIGCHKHIGFRFEFGCRYVRRSDYTCPCNWEKRTLKNPLCYERCHRLFVSFKLWNGMGRIGFTRNAHDSRKQIYKFCPNKANVHTSSFISQNEYLDF